jgi:hypothetical protein
MINKAEEPMLTVIEKPSVENPILLRTQFLVNEKQILKNFLVAFGAGCSPALPSTK